MRYEDIAHKLTPETLSLFIEMVEQHLSVTGDRKFTLIGHGGGPTLTFWGGDWQKEKADEGAINDLVEYGLLRITRRKRSDTTYEVRGEAINFYRYLMKLQGEPVEQVEVAAVRLVDGQGFGRRHPSATKHIREAMELQRSNTLTVPTITEIGTHLRSAVFDVAANITEAVKDREYPVPELEAKVEASGLQDREKVVLTRLVALVDSVLRLDHRLAHVRDEADKGEPEPSPREVRRAVYVTIFALAELDRAFAD